MKLAGVPAATHAVNFGWLECDAIRYEQPQDRSRLLNLRPEQPPPVLEFVDEIAFDLAPVNTKRTDTAKVDKLVIQRCPAPF